MLQKVKELKKESTGAKAAGFTIIEVMIVLAIAGLIMAMVFVAVPALQRNARTQQRTADAQLILAGVGECLSNKNNVIASCDTFLEVGAFADFTKLKALATTVGASAFAANGGFVTATGQAPAVPATPPDVTSTWVVSYNTKCDADGTTSTIVTNQREYAINFEVENNTGKGLRRCLQG